YLDPASGSALLYIIISVFGAVVYFFKNAAVRIFQFFAVRLRFRSDFNKKDGIVFYSEGRQYWNVFYPVLTWLSQNGYSCSYLTSDKEDPGLKAELPQVSSKYIGSMHMAPAYLNRL